MPAFQSFFMVFKASRSVFEIAKFPDYEEERSLHLESEAHTFVVES